MSHPSKIRIKAAIRPKGIYAGHSPKRGINAKGLMVAEHAVLLDPKQLVIQRQWHLSGGCATIRSLNRSSLNRSSLSSAGSSWEFSLNRWHGVFGGEILILNSPLFLQLPHMCVCAEVLGNTRGCTRLPHKNLFCPTLFSFFLFLTYFILYIIYLSLCREDAGTIIIIMVTGHRLSKATVILGAQRPLPLVATPLGHLRAGWLNGFSHNTMICDSCYTFDLTTVALLQRHSKYIKILTNYWIPCSRMSVVSLT